MMVGESSSRKKVKHSDEEDPEDDEREIPLPEFDVSQTVLARDKDGLLYEAIIRRSIWGIQQHSQITVGMVNSQEEIEQILDQDKIPTWHYFVHYSKWKSNWDRWVGQEDLLPLTPENQDVAEEIRRAHKFLLSDMKTNKGKKVDGGAFLKVWKVKLKSLTGDQSRGVIKKPKVTRKTWQRDVSLRKRNLSSANSNPSHQVVLPFGLKKILVEDWEIVNHFKMVHRLPASVTISHALDLYTKSKGVEEGSGWFGQVQNCETPETYQCATPALPFRLLYPPEQAQVSVMDSLQMYKDKPKIELYGCEFLLRLFCQLPAIIGDNCDEEDDIGKVVTAKLNDFVRFLNKNQSTLFAQSYRRHNDLELVYEIK
ncbi:unnamed protein product [Cylindrotheca closterium]|uniref:MRG domain-containing protein n=1 Tax=Cylindrotheca closterium TaxID=2856 RepID=A0AAD2FRQ0_9STRA|nr:unnamed protein product [Cylindrotheca closterium]